MPLPPASMNDRGPAPEASTNFFSIQTLITNGPPVTRWQSRQWQAWTINGLAVSSYRMALQAHPPFRVIVPPRARRTGARGFGTM